MKTKFTIDIYLNDTQISLLTKYDWEKGVRYDDLSCDEDIETFDELQDLEIIKYQEGVLFEHNLTLYGEKIFQQLNK